MKLLATLRETYLIVVCCLLEDLFRAWFCASLRVRLSLIQLVIGGGGGGQLGSPFDSYHLDKIQRGGGSLIAVRVLNEFQLTIKKRNKNFSVTQGKVANKRYRSNMGYTLLLVFVFVKSNNTAKNCTLRKS